MTFEKQPGSMRETLERTALQARKKIGAIPRFVEGLQGALGAGLFVPRQHAWWFDGARLVRTKTTISPFIRPGGLIFPIEEAAYTIFVEMPNESFVAICDSDGDGLQDNIPADRETGQRIAELTGTTYMALAQFSETR